MTYRRNTHHRLTLIPILAVALAAPAAHAVNIQQYSRSNSLTFEMLEDARIENSHVYSDFDSIITLGASYVDEPLVVKNSGNGSQVDALIPSMKNAHFGLGWYARSWLQLGATANYSVFRDNQGESHRGFNDLELKTKFRLIRRERDAFSIMPTLSIPSKAGEMRLVDSSGVRYGADHVLSDEGVGYGARLIYERVFRNFQMVANLGYVQNHSALFTDSQGVSQIDYRKRMITGVGAYLPVFARAGVNIEFLKVWTTPLFNDRLNPTEMHLGFSTAISDKLHFFSGVNFGNLLSDSDGNDYRLVLGLKFIPRLGRSSEASDDRARSVKRSRVVEERPLDCHDVFPFKHGVRSLTVLFARGEDEVGPDQSRQLNKLAHSLSPALNQIEKITIHGHASQEPVATQHAYTNEGLAQGRAQAVERILLDTWGDSAHPPISIEAYSDARPLKRKTDANADELNRRAEIIVQWRKEYEHCSKP